MNANEGTISWTSGTSVAAGTQITLVPPIAPSTPGYAFLGNISSTAPNTTNGTVSKIDGSNTNGNGIVLGPLGDQIFAFQGGSLGTLPGSGTLISGIHWYACTSGGTNLTTSSGWDPNSCGSTGSSPSQLPTYALSNGFSALYIPPASGTTPAAQAVYVGPPGSTSNLNAVRSSVYNSSNWQGSTSTGGELATPSAIYATPLPVNWLSFSGVSRNGSIVLDWKVGDEKQTAGYAIERSEGGTEFEVVGTQKILGDGGSYEYRYTDNQLGNAPVYYYRLRSLERSGVLQYSSTIRVANTISTANSGVRLLRNPAGASLDLEVAAAADGIARIAVTDLTGRIVLQQEWPVHAGRQAVSCPTTGLQPDQVYLLTGTADGKVWHARVVR